MNYSNSANWTGMGEPDQVSPYDPSTAGPRQGMKVLFTVLVIVGMVSFGAFALVGREHIPVELQPYKDAVVAPSVNAAVSGYHYSAGVANHLMAKAKAALHHN